MTHTRPDLRRAAAGGVIWGISSQTARQGIQIVVTAVLARHLLPADFGLIGMASVALTMVAPLSEMGLGAALVQRRDLEPGHPVAVFWCQMVVAVVMALLLAAAAPLVTRFFGREELVPILRVMCVALPIGAVASAPQALLQRRLEFATIAMVETIALGGAGAVAVAFALAGWGVWSLVAQSIVGAALTAAVFLVSARFNPLSRSARPRLAHLRSLRSFSLPLTGFQVFNFFSRNIDDVLIGRMLGAEALGYYTMAYRVMMYPLQKVSDVVGRVTFPTFSGVADDVDRLRRGYVKTIQYIALLTFPMMAAVIVIAPALVSVAFGPGWEPVAPLIAILSLAGMAHSVGTTVGGLLLARGRASLMLRWEILAAACYTVAIVAGLPWGLQGVAAAYTGMALILWPISHLVANRTINLRLVDLYRRLLPPAGLALVVGGALGALQLAWRPGSPATQAAFLGVAAALCILILAAAAALGRPAACGEVIVLAREAFRGARG